MIDASTGTGGGDCAVTTEVIVIDNAIEAIMTACNLTVATPWLSCASSRPHDVTMGRALSKGFRV